MRFWTLRVGGWVGGEIGEGEEVCVGVGGWVGRTYCAGARRGVGEGRRGGGGGGGIGEAVVGGWMEEEM